MGKYRIHWLCFPFLRLTSSFRKCPLSKRSLIIASVCVVHLLLVVSHFGYSQQQRERGIDKDKYRNARGLYNLDISDALPDSVDLQTGASFVVPTRSNVVYITLKSKRLKPAHIRGTIRPKLRRKVRRNKEANSAFTQYKLGTLERDAGQIKRNFASRTSFGETRDVYYKSLYITHTSHTDTQIDSHISYIRIYSQRAPPWLSPQDVEAMRFLADANVLRIKEVSHGDSPTLLIFEGETSVPMKNQKHIQRSNVCGGQCGVINSPVDTTEVFAFHLDRVLGLNRTLPAVSRKFSFLHDGQPCPVVSWDASLYPEGLAAGRSTMTLTWGEYQNSLKQKCWHKNISPKPDSGCFTVHHYEWSKLALFDFLLQIHNRLDQSCCGFRPRQEDVCVELGHHAQCGDPNHIQLTNIIHKDHDPRHLVFTNNKGFFDRNEDNLDFRLLEGIKELPEQAVSVLKSKRLREKLLQSLFLDQTYWESQGGRQGIDKLIDVIERRAKVLLTYINAHGIKVTTMHV
ncbi:Golgi-associated kinase 1B [Sander lucioperca]|uniref:Golgi-associated kinase 1B n=1 Tax=Sander lucioperca TaxID=283035 RepID=UPI00125E0E69|nr:Golgi-associated kinase 1B [Sander lucioperca]XP_035856881.1 Golgi-associated kinase 1B [Sander lucioperca]